MSRIVITGASSGIGRACAELFAAKGWQLIVLARREELLSSLAEDLHARMSMIRPHDTNLSPTDIGARLAEKDSEMIADLDWVASNGKLLDVDIFVLGTIQRHRRVDSWERDILEIEVMAWSMAERQIVAKETFEVSSDRPENRDLFRLAERSASW